MTVKRALPAFDKYYYYSQSVQSPEADVEFLQETFQSLCGYEAKTLREDFCGTFAVCCSWVQSKPFTRALGVDLDSEPIEYGKAHYLTNLNADQKMRLEVEQRNVLDASLPKADLVSALNFSYYCFKDRATLRDYFANVYRTLEPNGLFVIDCFGGGKCHESNEEETEDADLKYSYFWDQDEFDPISHHCMFYIHFKRNGEAKREKVFVYDWRLWTIPELRDILAEVGFKSTHVYWEGDDDDSDGEGNGVFELTKKGEECEAWVAYIAAKKS